MVPQCGGDAPLLGAAAGAQLTSRARQVSAQQLQAGIRRSRHHKHRQRRGKHGGRLHHEGAAGRFARAGTDGTAKLQGGLSQVLLCLWLLLLLLLLLLMITLAVMMLITLAVVVLVQKEGRDGDVALVALQLVLLGGRRCQGGGVMRMASGRQWWEGGVRDAVSWRQRWEDGVTRAVAGEQNKGGGVRQAACACGGDSGGGRWRVRAIPR